MVDVSFLIITFFFLFYFLSKQNASVCVQSFSIFFFCFLLMIGETNLVRKHSFAWWTIIHPESIRNELYVPSSLLLPFSLLTRLNECRTYKYWKDILRLQESLPVIRFIHSLYRITCLPNRIFRWSKS